MKEHNKVAVVILSFNVEDDLKECLDSLLKQTYQSINIIVVDGGSSDGSCQLVSEKYPKIKLISLNYNAGFTGGNNIGIKEALRGRCEYVFTLNPDTLVSKNLISDLVSYVENNTKVGIVSPKIYFAKGYEYHKDRYTKDDLGKVFWFAGGKTDWNNILTSHVGVDEVDKGQYDTVRKTDFISGCAMFVKSDVFEKVGLFDDKYFLYLEDNDFCVRAQRVGFETLYVPIKGVWHKNAKSSGVGSTLQDYYITRNRLLFGLKYSSMRTKFALLREAIRFVVSNNKTKKKAVMDFFTLHFGRGENYE